MMKIMKEQESLPFSRALHFVLHFSMDTIHGGSEEAVRAAEQNYCYFRVSGIWQVSGVPGLNHVLLTPSHSPS